jgi:hypothetical protein
VPVADAPGAAACVFCAGALGCSEFCVRASNWYARLVNAAGLKSLIKLATRSTFRMSVALSPIAASALLSDWSCVCCEALPAAEAAGADPVEVSGTLSVLCALPAPEAALVVVDCVAESVELDGSEGVLVAVNNPATLAVESADSARDDGVKRS